MTFDSFTLCACERDLFTQISIVRHFEFPSSFFFQKMCSMPSTWGDLFTQGAIVSHLNFFSSSSFFFKKWSVSWMPSCVQSGKCLELSVFNSAGACVSACHCRCPEFPHTMVEMLFKRKLKPGLLFHFYEKWWFFILWQSVMHISWSKS